MLKEDDAEMREMAKEEKKDAEQRIESLELDLQKLLLPKDPHDNSNIYLEVRAGTGGDEAAIFAGDLFPHVQPLRGNPTLAGRRL